MTHSKRPLPRFVFILLAALAQVACSKPPEIEGKAVVLKQQEFTDPARGNMPAMRLLVPEGWKVEGGVMAMPPVFRMIPTQFDITITAPDKRGVRFWGMQEFGYTDGVRLRPFSPLDGRPYYPPPQSLGQYWTHLVQMNPYPGVTRFEVVSEEVLPELTKRVREQLRPMYESTALENQQLRMSGEGKSFEADGRKLVFRYHLDGVPVEATVFTTYRRTAYHYPNGAIRALMWNLDNMYAVFGPQGTDYLSDPELSAIVRSRREVPEWQAAIQQSYLMIGQQIVAEGHARIAAQARQAATVRQSNSSELLDISFEGWKKREGMRDAGHALEVNSIHERTTYAVPSGGQVDLPSYYQNVYTDRLGNYVLHNDANYEINRDPAFNSRDWIRANPVR